MMEPCVSVGFDNGIVRYSHEAFVPEYPSVKVCRIIMVTTDEKKPVIAVVDSLGITSDDILIVPLSLKAESTISCHNNQSIFHLILDTHLIHEEVEIPVNIATNDNAATFGKIIYIVMRVGTHFRKAVLKRSRSRPASKPLSPAFLKKSGLGSSPIL